jgi:hypothetical protein
MNCQIVERDISLRGQELWDSMQPGDLVLDSYPFWEKPRGGYFKCPFNDEVWGLDYKVHTIISREPLTLSPSFICPDGCHFWVRDGKAIKI